MKTHKLTIHNIGKIEDAIIEFNEEDMREVDRRLIESTEITKKYIIKERAERQRQLCKERKLPNFVGDGSCSCGRNVFERYDGTGLVTGCPFCCKSFCD